MGKPTGNKKKHTGPKTNDLNPKPKKSGEVNSKAIDEEMTIFIKMSQELKEEGNILFQKRDYDGAMFKYGKALNLLPKNHIDIAYLHSNMAACYMQRGPGEYEQAIDECNMALDISPKYSKALLKRARCYEALDRLDFALNDVRTVLRFEPNNLMAQEIEERVRKALEEKGIQTDDKGVFLAPECEEPAYHSPKCTVMKEKTKKKKKTKRSSKAEDKAVIEEQPSTKEKKKKGSKAEDKTFVEEQPSTKYKKKTGKAEDEAVIEERSKGKEKQQSITEEDKAVVEEQPKPKEEVMRTIKLVFGEDIRWAQMAANCSVSELREIVRNRFPSLKSVLIKYKDQEGDLVTITTTEELRCVEASAHLQAARFFIVEVDPEHDPLFLHESENGVEPKQREIKQNGQISYMDDWIVEFAQLFKNHVGFDSDGYLELHDIGMKLYSEAIEDTVTCEDAQYLFDIAAGKFQEMAALALFNWGNVHMSRARKRMPLTEDVSTEAILSQVREAYEWAEKEYEKAGKKYREALDIKPDFYEGLLALGQQQFEHAKLAWYFAIGSKVDLDEWSSRKVIDLFEDAHKNIAKGTDMWEEMEAQRLSELSNPGYGKKQLIDGLFKELTTDEAAELAANMRSQINILWGTLLYERSIVEFKLGNDIWEDYLEASIERFKHAGASHIDTAVMRKNHCSNANAQEGIVFKIDEIVQAWNEMYDAKKWKTGVPSFRLEPLLRRWVPKLHHILEHL